MAVRDILLLAAVAVSLPVCLLRPVYGIVLLTILGFLNPQSFTYGIAHQVPLTEIVVIPTLAGFLFSGRFKYLFCIEMCLLCVLWAWFTLTTVNSANTPELAEKAADAWFRWGFVSKILLVTAATVGIMNTRARLRLLLLAIGVSFAILVLKTLPGMILSGGRFRIYGPDNSMIGDNTAFGLALDMVLPFFFYLAKTESNRFLKRFLGIAFVACIPAIFFTYSRGAFVGLVVLGAFMFLQSKQKLILIPMITIALLFGAFFAPQQWRDRISLTTDTSESSAKSRLNEWSYSWNLACAYPVMGGGFEAITPSLHAKYGNFAIDPNNTHGAHSIYFQVLAEHGFGGFSLYLLLVAYCFISLHGTLKLARLHDDEQCVDYANMLRFSLIGFLAAGAFLGRTYFDFYFMIVACIAILKQVSREDWAAESEIEEEKMTAGETRLPNHACV